MTLIAIFLTVLFLQSLVSQRLERTIVSPPIVFTAAGVLAAFFLRQVDDLHRFRSLFLLLAEVGLVLTLFADATTVRLRSLRNDHSLPLRLLSVGMLLTIAAGALAAVVVFPNLSVWEAGVLAAILAPTDAGLGQQVVNSPRVPARLREALNVEAGLNDGLCVPFMMSFLALSESGTDGAASVFSRHVGAQLLVGLVIGLFVGGVGGWLLGAASRAGWSEGTCSPLGMLALPLLCVIASERAGASMFIAAFVAGLAVQIGLKGSASDGTEVTEKLGRILDFFVFFLFGIFVAGAADQFDGPVIVYALLSLTIVRLAPVALAVLGTDLDRRSRLFVGWFGPRGLASIVLGLVYLEEKADFPGEPTIRLAVMATVLASVLAHGVSTLPGIDLLSGRTERRKMA